MIEEIFAIQRETEKSLIGQKVRLTFNDGTTEEGILEKEQPVEGLSFPKKKYSIMKSDGSRTFFSKKSCEKDLEEMEVMKKFQRYGGVILFAIVAAMKLIKLTAAQEYEFAGIFCLWVILSFFEGWLTHCLYINPELFKLHNDNIRYMMDNMKLMDQLKEEREKNGTERSEKDS